MKAPVGIEHPGFVIRIVDLEGLFQFPTQVSPGILIDLEINEEPDALVL